MSGKPESSGLTEPLKSGTYQITSARGDMCIKDLDGKAVGWSVSGDIDERWYIQKSDEGYSLKNCQTGRYLTVEGTSGLPEPICGAQLTTWDATRRNQDGLVNIDDTSEKPSKKARLEPQAAPTKNQQATEKETPVTMDRNLQERDTLVAEKDRQLGEITSQLAARDQELAQARLESAESLNRLAAQHQELDRIRLELVEARTRLVETQGALRQSEEKLALRDAQLS
ncbi:hypothetical protein FRC09_009446 [Ceratobasidium sp. 395]|nr:hypothetical protein FRC09_009446 [Ceratobasidium sp. 395]